MIMYAPCFWAGAQLVCLQLFSTKAQESMQLGAQLIMHAIALGATATLKHA